MLAPEIGIDAGSANTLVVAKRRGLVHQEPSVVALNRRTRAVIAVGTEASDMVGKEPGHVIAVHPIRGGVVSELDPALALFRHLLRRSGGSRFMKPKLILSVPSAATSVERKALADLALEAGAGDVTLVEETLAAALGANLPVTEAVGTLIVHIGAGRTAVSVISLGAPVLTMTTDAAGYTFDDMIAKYARKAHNLLIGDRTAERVKRELTNSLRSSTSIPLAGRHLATGLPVQVTLDPRAVIETLGDAMSRIELVVRQVLELTPPELMADISRAGIVLTGGGALTHGLGARLEASTNLRVRIADDPMLAVAEGTRRLIEQKSKSVLTFKVRR